jgi:outer membrane protein
MIYAPAFLGSDDYQLSGYPDIKVEYKDLFFASVGDGIGYNFINNYGWRVGPIAKYAFKRKEDGESDFRISGDETNALRGLGDVDGTIELGGYAEYSFEPFSYKVELRQGVNGHEGMIGEMSLNYAGAIKNMGPPVFFAIGPQLKFADSDYNNAYFGINQTQSANSGLARYSADNGLVSYGFGGFASLPVGDKISLSMFGGYERLGSEVADSPLVQERGNENQFAAGLNLSYKFSY